MSLDKIPTNAGGVPTPVSVTDDGKLLVANSGSYSWSTVNGDPTYPWTSLNGTTTPSFYWEIALYHNYNRAFGKMFRSVSDGGSNYHFNYSLDGINWNWSSPTIGFAHSFSATGKTFGAGNTSTSIWEFNNSTNTWSAVSGVTMDAAGSTVHGMGGVWIIVTTGTNQFHYRSVDNGVTWTKVSTGYDISSYVYALRWDAQNGARIWFAQIVSPGTIYRSINDGSSFGAVGGFSSTPTLFNNGHAYIIQHPYSQTLFTRQFSASPNYQYSLWRSTDFGSNWALSYINGDVNNDVTSVEYGQGRVLMTVLEYATFPTSYNLCVYESFEQGASGTWKKTHTFPTNEGSSHLFFAAGKWVLSITTPTFLQDKFYESYDGYTWTEAINAYPYQPSVSYYFDGIYLSESTSGGAGATPWFRNKPSITEASILAANELNRINSLGY